MTRRLTLIAALALVALGGFFLYGQRAGTGADPMAAYAQDADSVDTSMIADMTLGDQNAPVKLIEYASFTCPHCANFHDTVFDKMKADYIDTGKVKFVYREVYFDRYGLLAAMIAREGGPEKYFAISDVLYETQKDWLAPGEDKGIIENLRKIGLKSGLPTEGVDETIAEFETCVADLKACMATDNIAGAMVATYQTNATKDNVQGTPTFIINGETVSGEMSYEDFAKILDGKLDG